MSFRAVHKFKIDGEKRGCEKAIQLFGAAIAKNDGPKWSA